MGRPLSIDKRIDRFFAHRPRSVVEAERFFLYRLKLSTQEIKQQMDKLSRSGLLNDEAFVAWWINERTNKRPRSMLLINQELLQKGVNKELIERFQQNTQTDDTTTIKELIKQKSKSIERKYSNEIRKRKFIEYLMRRGYSYSLSASSLEDYYKKM